MRQKSKPTCPQESAKKRRKNQELYSSGEEDTEGSLAEFIDDGDCVSEASSDQEDEADEADATNEQEDEADATNEQDDEAEKGGVTH